MVCFEMPNVTKYCFHMLSIELEWNKGFYLNLRYFIIEGLARYMGKTYLFHIILWSFKFT